MSVVKDESGIRSAFLLSTAERKLAACWERLIRNWMVIHAERISILSPVLSSFRVSAYTLVYALAFTLALLSASADIGNLSPRKAYGENWNV